MFTSDLMLWAAVLAVAAIGALVALDRREPARTRPVVARAHVSDVIADDRRRGRRAGRDRAPVDASPGDPPPASVVGLDVDDAGRVLPRRRRPVAVIDVPTKRYKRTPIWRRVFALGGLGAIGVVIGVVLAIVIAAIVIGGMLLLTSAAR